MSFDGEKRERQRAAGALKQTRENERHQKQMLALHKKAMKSGSGRPAPKRSTRGRAARATRGAGSWSRAGRVPALLGKIHGGEGDTYMFRQPQSWLIGSNMLGQTPAERAAEFAIDCTRHPRVRKNMLVHVSISRPTGETLTPEIWHEVIKDWMRNIGAEGCNYISGGHSNTPNQHAHVYFSRARRDGTLVSLSNNFWSWREALRQTERNLNITTTQVPQHIDTSTSDRMENARRRAARLGKTDDYIDPNAIRNVLHCVVTYDQFSSGCKALGIDVKKRSEKNGNVTGILYRRVGSEAYLSGGSVSRDLTLPKVMDRIESNRLMALKKQEQEHHFRSQRHAEQQRALEQAQKQNNFERGG